MGYFTGKTILITGAGSGLGRCMALAMAREGGCIIAWELHPPSLSSLLDELAKITGRDHLGFVCDVGDNQTVYRAAQQVKTRIGTPDILINNASVVSGKPLLKCSDAQIRHTLAVNTLALFWTVKAFLPEMIARNAGHVVTVASVAGLVGAAGLTDYCASKFAAVGFDESLRAELRQTAPGVRTTVICSYYIDTGMFAGVKTRFPLLLPIVDEQYAADRMVTAIRRRRPRLIMPPLVFTLPLLRLLPVAWFDWITDFLGVNVSMTTFKGRANQKKD